MNALIVYPGNKEQLDALKIIMKAMNIAFEQKNISYPDHVVEGVKASLKQAHNKELSTYAGVAEMLDGR